MSSYTYADLVPFAAFVGRTSGCQGADDDCHPFVLVSCGDFDPDEEVSYQTNFNGWKQSEDHSDTGLGLKENLYATPWTDGKHVVWAINEDQYAAGGAIAITVFADKRADIKAFFKAVLPGTTPEIEKDAIVQQTL